MLKITDIAQANADGFYAWKESSKRFDQLLDTLPDRIWLE